MVEIRAPFPLLGPNLLQSAQRSDGDTRDIRGVRCIKKRMYQEALEIPFETRLSPCLDR